MHIPFGLALICTVAACGGDDDSSTDFSPCGGNIERRWNFTRAEVEGDGDGCGVADGEATIAGLLAFTPATRRFSVSPIDVKLWKKDASSACGFREPFGGFYKVNGNRVCFAVDQATVDASPCDGSENLGASDPKYGSADYCVQDNVLTLSSSDVFYLRFPALMTLSPAM